jgi:hypothetical protein
MFSYCELIRRHAEQPADVVCWMGSAAVGADRGFFSENNLVVCVRGGAATVSIPQRGSCKTPQRRAYERSPASASVPASRAHLGVDAWPRHEALPRRKRRAFRAICRRCGTRQQSHDRRRTLGQTLQTSPQTEPRIIFQPSRALQQYKSASSQLSKVAQLLLGSTSRAKITRADVANSTTQC